MSAPALSDSVARTLITQRVDAGMGVGIVAGLLDASGPRVVSYGQSGTGHALDGNTVFEIGSISHGRTRGGRQRDLTNRVPVTEVAERLFSLPRRRCSWKGLGR